MRKKSQEQWEHDIVYGHSIIIKPKTFYLENKPQDTRNKFKTSLYKATPKYPDVSSYIKDNTTNHKWMHPLNLKKKALPRQSIASVESVKLLLNVYKLK